MPKNERKIKIKQPLKRRGEEILERGETPLLPTLPLPLVREGGQGDRLLNNLQTRGM